MFAEAVLIEFQHMKVWNLSTESTKEGYSVPTRWSMTQPIQRIKICSEKTLIRKTGQGNNCTNQGKNVHTLGIKVSKFYFWNYALFPALNFSLLLRKIINLHHRHKKKQFTALEENIVHQ